MRMNEQFLQNENERRLVEDCMRLMRETPSGKIDAAFVFGRAQGDWEQTATNDGLLETAARLYRQGVVPVISIPGTEGSHMDTDPTQPRIWTGYPGAVMWRGCLQSLKVHTEDIVATRGEGYHTRSEGDDLVVLAKERGWKTVVVLAYPHQVLRAMLGIVKSMKEQQYSLTIRVVCPEHVDWDAPVYGSQGKMQKPRREHIGEEWERIRRYQEKGDIVSFQELYDYLMATQD